MHELVPTQIRSAQPQMLCPYREEYRHSGFSRKGHSGRLPHYPSGMSIGDRLRKERKAQGYTQTTLAEAAGVSQTTINDLENGDTQRPRGDTLMALARVLQIAPSWLMTGKGEKKMIYAATQHQETMLVLMKRMPLAAQEQLLAIARTFDDSPPEPPPDLLSGNVTVPRLPRPPKPS